VKHIFFDLQLAVLLTVFACVVSAQDNPRVDCPGTNVLASDEAVTDGDKVTFHVELIGGNVDRSKLEYDWHVDRGRIVSGQGKPVIVVSTSGAGSGGSVTAMVDISPYRECCWVTSQTVYVRRKGTRTNADSFWEWLWFNGARVQFADLEDSSVIETEIRERLDQIDPNLTLTLGSRNGAGKRELIIGWAAKSYDSKAVNDFVARAPNFVIFNIIFKNTSIDYPKDLGPDMP
jgi:hypothetical protein